MKEDPAAAARALFTALGAIEVLKVAFYPFVPFSSQRLHAMLGHDDTIEDQGWTARRPSAGGKLGTPEPLFKKLEVPATA
jgi:methionyl-tRNA synthetase